MATFKVGQRVRVKAIAGVKPEFRGREGTFAGYENLLDADCRCRFDGDTIPMRWGRSATLEPADPKADQFIEGLKKLANEPLVLTPEETLQIAGGRQ